MNVFICFQRVVHRNASFCLNDVSGKFKMVELGEAHYAIPFNEMTEIRFLKPRLNKHQGSMIIEVSNSR